jgi:hypothetical protein
VSSWTFPAAYKRLVPGRFAPILVWPEDQIDRWAERQPEKAETILRLVG